MHRGAQDLRTGRQEPRLNQRGKRVAYDKLKSGLTLLCGYLSTPEALGHRGFHEVLGSLEIFWTLYEKREASSSPPSRRSARRQCPGFGRS